MPYNSIYNMIGFNNEVDRLGVQAKLGWEKEFRTLKWLGLKDGMSILDVGSGPGFYTELLLENLPHSHITDLEVDEKLIGIAEKRLENYYYLNRLDFRRESVLNNRIKDNSYDFAICRFLLQHVNNPFKVVKEIYRVLKPGGIIAVIDNDKSLMGLSDPEYLMKRGRGFFQEIEKKAKWNREIGRKIVKLLKASGYVDLDFEAVTIHSDLIGMSNMFMFPKIRNKQMTMMNMANNKLAQLSRAYMESNIENNCTVILLNLIAKGVKK